jgi:hypothetical protein
MTPTAKLRFVERVVPAPEYGEGIGKTVRILQQWWEDSSGDLASGVTLYGEWRDVPLETEE